VGFATVVVGKAVLGKPITLAEAWDELQPRLPALLGVMALFTAVVVVGLMLFVIPGIWLYVVFALAAPAVILARAAVGEAFRRARDLVRRSWWRVAGIIAAAFLVLFLAQAVLSAPFVMLDGGPSPDLLSMTTLGEILATAITAPFFACVVALIYVDRRFRTDDLALELARAAGLAP
jgi:hypothetical protein